MLGPRTCSGTISGVLHRRCARAQERNQVGLDCIMVETDFPQSDSNWPNSRTRSAAVFSDTHDNEFPKLSWTRARHRRGP
jgi:hypothetical protein